MSYTSRWPLAQEGVVAQAIAMALVSAAVSVSSEVNTTPNHTNRVALAHAVVLNPLQWGFTFAPGVLDNLIIDTQTQLIAVSDAQVDAAVAALWNTYAGVQ